MPILNENATFQDLSSEQQGSFRGGGTHVTKVLLAAGTRLRKNVRGGGYFNRESPYWMLEDDWKLHIKARRPDGVTQEATTRAKLAVSESFQPDLDRPLYGRLLQPVWAFRGPARHQPLVMSDPKVVLMGGAPQVVIPNLTNKHIMVLHPVA